MEGLFRPSQGSEAVRQKAIVLRPFPMGLDIRLQERQIAPRLLHHTFRRVPRMLYQEPVLLLIKGRELPVFPYQHLMHPPPVVEARPPLKEPHRHEPLNFPPSVVFVYVGDHHLDRLRLRVQYFNFCQESPHLFRCRKGFVGV